MHLQGMRLSCRLSGCACMLGAGPTTLQRQCLLCAGLGGLGSCPSCGSFSTLGCVESPGAPQSSCSRCTCSCRSRRLRPESTRSTSSGSRSSCSCSPCCGAPRGPAPALPRRLRPPAALTPLSCQKQTPLMPCSVAMPHDSAADLAVATLAEPLWLLHECQHSSRSRSTGAPQLKCCLPRLPCIWHTQAGLLASRKIKTASLWRYMHKPTCLEGW